MKILKKVYRKTLRILPKRLANYIIYFRGYKKMLHLQNPKYFGEKIQWLKLYGGLDKLYKYVDKYEVRDYVKETIGPKYLNELYGVYDKVEDIDYEKLPNKFVLKSTNGSGQVIICKDKKTFDIKSANKELKKLLKDNYYKEKKEPQYKNIKNRIIIEKYLEDDMNGSLTDYKFFCYNGEPLYCGIYYDRYTDKRIDFYRCDGTKLEGCRQSKVPNSDKHELFDKRMNDMMNISRKLSKKFTFVRVDFYYINKKIIFGELTFTDGAGSDSFDPLEIDLEFAKDIDLKEVLKSGE